MTYQGNIVAHQNRRFTVVLEPEAEGGFTVRVPSLLSITSIFCPAITYTRPISLSAGWKFT